MRFIAASFIVLIPVAYRFLLIYNDVRKDI